MFVFRSLLRDRPTASRWLKGACALAGLAAVTAGRLSAAETLVSIKALAPQELRTEGFILDSAQDVQIDAVGSASRLLDRLGSIHKLVDDEIAKAGWPGNAWILNLRTREVVWELRKMTTTRDARDLRKFSGPVRLPAGIYEAHYSSFIGASMVVISDPKGQRVRRQTRVEELTDAFELTIRGNGRPAGLAERARARQEFEKNAVVVLTGVGRQAAKDRGFNVSRTTEVEVYCIGEAREDGSFDYGTIVRADTGEKIWQLTYKNSEPAGGSAKNRLFRRTLTLQPGKYIASYNTDDTHDQRGWNDAPPYDPEYWGLTLRVPDPGRRMAIKTFDFELLPKRDVFAQLVGIGNGQSRSIGFTLLRPVTIRIYAVGEGSDGHMHDRGWITDAQTRKKVWEMDFGKTTHAGGAQKNRLADQTVTLEKGNYLVYYSTDDSHAYQAWNSAQPAHPEMWGISLFLMRGTADRAAVQPYERGEETGVIAKLTRMGDMEDARKSFKLDRPTEVRILAMGESTGNRLHDFAWIEDARTRKIVWKMDIRATAHAGGGQKNRVATATITLPPGEYILRYESDDSHSFGNWNVAPPDDPDAWGITIYRAGT